MFQVLEAKDARFVACWPDYPAWCVRQLPPEDQLAPENQRGNQQENQLAQEDRPSG